MFKNINKWILILIPLLLLVIIVSFYKEAKGKVTSLENRLIACELEKRGLEKNE